MIDGEIVTTMSSGAYYFAGFVERFAESVRAVRHFFTGHRQDEDELSHERDSERLNAKPWRRSV